MPAMPNDIKKIKKLQKKFIKIELLVIKQTKATSKLGSSRPCAMCLKMMQILKIKNVFYTNSDGNIIMEKVSRMTSTHQSQMTKYMENPTHFTK
jgi:tRNA(Arg) A34 adenosine deaminase TadA